MLGTENRESRTHDWRNDTAADVVGDIPESPDTAAFTAREPFGDSNKRRTDAHALEQTVEGNETDEQPERAAEAHTEVNNGTEDQTKGHKGFRAGFIRQAAHNPFADPVSDQHAAG